MNLALTESQRDFFFVHCGQIVGYIMYTALVYCVLCKNLAFKTATAVIMKDETVGQTQ